MNIRRFLLSLQWRRVSGMEENKKPTHRRHNKWHDYKERCIYHITLVVSDRVPLLASLEATDGNDARMELTPLGAAVSQQLNSLQERAREKGCKVRILAKCIMDTHLHFILFVEETLPIPMGVLIRGLKQGCNSALKEALALAGLMEEATTTPTAPKSIAGVHPSFAVVDEGFSSPKAIRIINHGAIINNHRLTSARILNDHALFEEDFDETILIRHGQLKRMIDYVHQNPYRKWVKLNNKDRFMPVRNVEVAGKLYDAIGNMMLLGLARKEVHVRRRFSEAERKEYMNDCVKKARQNYALVSPFISDYESAVRDFCLKEGHSVIQLVDNGFTDFTTCPGGLFEYCQNGQVLLLVPSEFPHIDKKGTISRAECQALNSRAEEIADMSP